MNLKIYLAILLTALNVCLYECEEDDNKRRCGEELSIFLAQTCHNTFAGVQVSKKSKYFPRKYQFCYISFSININSMHFKNKYLFKC